VSVGTGTRGHAGKWWHGGIVPSQPATYSTPWFGRHGKGATRRQWKSGGSGEWIGSHVGKHERLRLQREIRVYPSEYQGWRNEEQQTDCRRRSDLDLPEAQIAKHYIAVLTCWTWSSVLELCRRKDFLPLPDSIGCRKATWMISILRCRCLLGQPPTKLQAFGQWATECCCRNSSRREQQQREYVGSLIVLHLTSLYDIGDGCKKEHKKTTHVCVERTRNAARFCRAHVSRWRWPNFDKGGQGISAPKTG